MKAANRARGETKKGSVPLVADLGQRKYVRFRVGAPGKNLSAGGHGNQKHTRISGQRGYRGGDGKIVWVTQQSPREMGWPNRGGTSQKGKGLRDDSTSKPAKRDGRMSPRKNWKKVCEKLKKKGMLKKKMGDQGKKKKTIQSGKYVSPLGVLITRAMTEDTGAKRNWGMPQEFGFVRLKS